MGIATFFSRILGLVREQVFAILFGAGNATDAFNIAFRIPNLLRDLFAEGAMSAALVPTFTRVRKEQGERRAWRVAGLVFRVLFFFVALVSILGIVFAEPLVALYAGSFREVPGKFELTVEMTRILFPFFPLVALAAAFMGVLNACGRFFLPAFASALFNFASIVTGVALAMLFPRWGWEPIVGMAVGVVIGGAVQAFCQLPSLRAVGYRWSARDPAQDPSWHQDPALRRMLAMMLPGMIGLAATQVNILVNSILATSQGPGAVSWLNYAFRLLQFPIGVFGVSLAAATLPRVSLQWVDQDAAGVGQTLTRSLKHVFAINLPASAGLAFLGYPIIQLLFEYGRFSPEDTSATAAALAYYSVGLVAYSAVKVLVPACYALGNTRLPVISSVLSVVLTIILNLLLVGPLSYRGLALGTSIAAVFNALFLYRGVQGILGRFQGGMAGKSLLSSLFWNLVIALAMGGVCYASWQALERSFPLESLPVILSRSLKLGGLVVEGVVVVVLLAWVFRLQETNEVIDIFSRKLKKKLSRNPN